MAESPSSSTTHAEADAGAAGAADGVAPTLAIVVGEDGVPVVDLRDAPARDGALVVIEDELVLRLADGTEWPIDNFFGDAAVLQVGDEAFVAAEAVKAAIAAAGTALPVASLAAAAAPAPADGAPSTPQGEVDEAAEPASEPVRGGAEFRAFEIAALGDLLEPTLQLAATSQELGGGQSGDELLADAAGRPGNGSRFVNLDPIANDDHAVTSERQAIEIDVLANDRDPNPGDQVRLVGIDATGLKGTLGVTPEGTLVYDPNGQFTHLGLGETATETITYAIADRHGGTSTATVTITVEGVNDAPVAANDDAVTDERSAVVIDVLANDSDPDANDVVQVVAVEPAGLRGNLGYLGDGQFVYDPAGQFTHLGKGQTASETFLYMIADQHGATSIAEVEVLIHGVNDAPVAVDDVVIVSEKGEVRFDALANDYDPDNGDTIRVSNLFSLGGSKGQRWIDHEGTVTYRPYGAYDYLGEGEHAVQQFGYTITDQHGATDTAVISVIVMGVNDAPIARDDKAVTNEDIAVVVNVIANDYDIDINDTIQVVAVDLTGLEGNLAYLGDGKFAYDPSGAFDHLAVGQSATETFRYMISDQHGATSIASVEILIHGVNDAPVATDDVVFVSEKGEVRFDALANDYDADNGDTIRVSNLFSLGGSKGQRWIDHEGTVTYRPYGAYDYLGEGEFAVQEFGYTVSDQHGATDTGKISVIVVGVNDAPIARGDKAVTNEDTAVVVNVIANDYDIDVNDTIQVVAVDLTGLQGNLAYLGNGQFAYDPSGAFDHLAVGQSATDSFRYMISDQHGATSIATAEVLIQGVNDAPTAVDDHIVGYETIGFYAPIAALLANDYDVDNGDTIHFAGLGGAYNGEVTLTPDGYVVFTPTPGYVGQAGFQYAIQDQHGAYDMAEVTVDVRPITPGDMEYQTLSWFAGMSDATVEVLENGVTMIDLFIEVGAVAAAGLEIGGMPFFSATLSGILQGVISVAILPDGTSLVTGNLVGDLDLQIETSPIFAALGGDVYDALYLASGTAGDPFGVIGGGGGGGGGAPGVPDLAFADALFDLVEQAVQAIDLGGIEALVAGQGIGNTTAIAFGDGVFYLDIAGLISGAITVPGGQDGAPLVDADIIGQFAAAAIFDIRDDLTVVSDGFVDGNFNAAVAPAGIGPGFAIGSIVSEEQAMAA